MFLLVARSGVSLWYSGNNGESKKMVVLPRSTFYIPTPAGGTSLYVAVYATSFPNRDTIRERLSRSSCQ